MDYFFESDVRNNGAQKLSSSSSWIVKFALKMFTFMTHFGENKIWHQTKKMFLSLTRIDFAVRISSMAVRVFPALSLRRVRSTYETFSLIMVFQRNCAWDRDGTGHMIIFVICPLHSPI